MTFPLQPSFQSFPLASSNSRHLGWCFEIGYVERLAERLRDLLEILPVFFPSVHFSNFLYVNIFFYFMRRPPPATGRIGPSSSARRILANVPVKSKLFALLRLNRETYVFYEHLCRGTQASTWVISHRRTTMCCSPHSFFVLSCCQLRLIRTPHLAPGYRGTWMVKGHNSPNCDRATRGSNPGFSAWQADVITTRPWRPYIFIVVPIGYANINVRNKWRFQIYKYLFSYS